jgi:hypothetical protein
MGGNELPPLPSAPGGTPFAPASVFNRTRYKTRTRSATSNTFTGSVIQVRNTQPSPPASKRFEALYGDASSGDEAMHDALDPLGTTPAMLRDNASDFKYYAQLRSLRPTPTSSFNVEVAF